MNELEKTAGEEFIVVLIRDVYKVYEGWKSAGSGHSGSEHTRTEKVEC